MSTEQMDPPGTLYPPATEPRGGPSTWLRAGIVLGAAVIIAVLTYVISNGVSATYRASTQLAISVPGQSGLGQDAVLGANQLTAQLVQIAPSDAVLQAPARQLGLSTSSLRSALSVGAQAQQNVLQISTTAGSRADAQARASAVTASLLAFVAASTRRQQQSYSQSVAGVLDGMNSQLRRLGAATGKLTPAQIGVIEGEAGAIAAQDQSLRAQVAQRAAASAPSVSVLSAATSASKVSPRPDIYAVVAFLAVAFTGLQLVNVGRWARRRA